MAFEGWQFPEEKLIESQQVASGASGIADPECHGLFLARFAVCSSSSSSA
jgi:hypothetical protein